jgi:hypothetical protein
MPKEILMGNFNFNATDYLNSNYFAAVDIAPDVRIEATVVSARPVDFKDGTSKVVVYTDYLAKGVVLNKTRLVEMIMAFSGNPANWIGQKIIIFRGETMYEGRKVPAVGIEPVVATRIGAEQRPALEGHNQSPPIENVPHGSGDSEDDLSFLRRNRQANRASRAPCEPSSFRL